MKRDMDLVRKILLKIEEAPTYDHPIRDLTIESYSNSEINYHVKILSQSGMIELFGEPIKPKIANTLYIPSELTWTGHEFLDSIRNKSLWEKVKQRIKDGGGSFTIDIIKALAIFELKNKLGI